MPPKRKVAPVSKTQQGTTKKRKGTAKSNDSTASDPWTRLNEDVVNLVLDYLSPRDLSRCEGVSSLWKSVVRRWILSFGLRTHFPDTCKIQKSHVGSDDDTTCYETFKHEAHLQYRIQSGRPLVVHDIPDDYGIVVAQSSFAGIDHGELCLYWHALGTSVGNESQGAEKQFPLKTIWRIKGGSVASLDTQINPEGLLLLRLQKFQNQQARSVVFSPFDSKVIWHQDHKKSNPKLAAKGELIPILIGKDLVYCARRGSNRDKFDLTAFDFRTGKLVYHSPVLQNPLLANAVVTNEWPESRRYAKLLEVAGGTELLVVSHGWQTSSSGISNVSIINGADGQLIKTISGPRFFHHAPPVAHPTLNQFAIQTQFLFESYGPLAPWKDLSENFASVIIVHTILLDSTNSFVELAIDVIFSEFHTAYAAIEPFARAVVTVQTNGLHSHSLEETEDTALSDTAKSIVKKLLPIDQSELRYCFVLGGDGEKVKYPRGSKVKPFAARDMPWVHIRSFSNGGRLSFRKQNRAYVMEF